MRREVLVFPIAALAFVAVADAAQDAEIRGATIALVPKTVAAIVDDHRQKKREILEPDTAPS